MISHIKLLKTIESLLLLSNKFFNMTDIVTNSLPKFIQLATFIVN